MSRNGQSKKHDGRECWKRSVRINLLVPVSDIIKDRSLMKIYEIHQIEVQTKRFIEIGFQNKKDLLDQFEESKYFLKKIFLRKNKNSLLINLIKL